MKKIDRLKVVIGERTAGTLAETKYGVVAFEYSDEWLLEGFSLNPFSLPLEKKVFLPEYLPFEGLFGVFADSLPDGWGRLLVDRYLKARLKENAAEVSNFYRLTMLSDAGMGAISYWPSYRIKEDETESLKKDYDEIALECKRLLEEDDVNDLDTLFQLGGSSGGARPKILTKVDGVPWIVKFPSSYDEKNIGIQEYEYSLCAKNCGIEMSETRLFPSRNSGGYFATKRFDRRLADGKEERIHMVSVSGLLETSHRFPNLDYHQLMKLTMMLTGDMEEVQRMFDLMCFNVFAHNRDDHSRNFSFLFDDKNAQWRLAPAYDLTYSSSIGGEHATTIDGEGRNPGMEHLLAVAKRAGLSVKKAAQRAGEIQEIVKEMLKEYL